MKLLQNNSWFDLFYLLKSKSQRGRKEGKKEGRKEGREGGKKRKGEEGEMRKRVGNKTREKEMESPPRLCTAALCGAHLQQFSLRLPQASLPLVLSLEITQREAQGLLWAWVLCRVCVWPPQLPVCRCFEDPHFPNMLSLSFSLQTWHFLVPRHLPQATDTVSLPYDSYGECLLLFCPDWVPDLAKNGKLLMSVPT